MSRAGSPRNSILNSPIILAAVETATRAAVNATLISYAMSGEDPGFAQWLNQGHLAEEHQSRMTSKRDSKADIRRKSSSIMTTKQQQQNVTKSQPDTPDKDANSNRTQSANRDLISKRRILKNAKSFSVDNQDSENLANEKEVNNILTRCSCKDLKEEELCCSSVEHLPPSPTTVNSTERFLGGAYSAHHRGSTAPMIYVSPEEAALQAATSAIRRTSLISSRYEIHFCLEN
ncbi:hypothetical protein Ciccas_004648 [Cichlidogyrus casuarinus]|uniref:Uncharacterized protein n=1 Tax=Cichlidogyrus casuarinus TaxID=1844966 RepID=A0ABD2QB12_9PLAT